MNARATIITVLGAAMVVLGLYVAGRMLVTGGGAMTGNRWLDGAFALFFILRGASNIVSAQRLRRAAQAPPAPES